ncbi:MAG: 16S rRNA (cytosine(1402)-N(4))-methyltransferase RsmH [Gammaproteobacteria bacterium]|nr:16S rRNA (cytosine(1402)-N(4))-methyltransferase RsmH [Gammaproteobacteria bacterium]
MEHVPVLPDETVRALVQKPSGLYVDGTFGRGGHARLLLGALDPSARLISLDADAAAFRAASALARTDPRVLPVRARFSELSEHMPPGEGAAGVMLDIGVSSPQLDDAERGFSFNRDGPLDMRMDQRRDMTAADWLGSASEGEIADVLRRYGEERHAGRIARRIALKRPLRTTGELREVVMEASPAHGRDALRQAATRVFQAIRIHINDELAELDRGLDAALEALLPGGRLAVITFHSLEHRLVRQRFRDWQQGPPTPRRLPVPTEFSPLAKAVGKGIRPNAAETAANPRSRSALLQVVEKLGRVEKNPADCSGFRRAGTPGRGQEGTRRLALPTRPVSRGEGRLHLRVLDCFAFGARSAMGPRSDALLTAPSGRHVGIDSASRHIRGLSTCYAVCSMEGDASRPPARGSAPSAVSDLLAPVEASA